CRRATCFRGGGAEPSVQSWSCRGCRRRSHVIVTSLSTSRSAPMLVQVHTRSRAAATSALRSTRRITVCSTGTAHPRRASRPGRSTRVQSGSSPLIRRLAPSLEHSPSRPVRRSDRPARSISLRDRSAFGNNDSVSPFVRTIQLYALLAAAGCTTRSAPAPPRDWPVTGGDPGNTRYSPLTQIDRRNVARLRLTWTYHSGDVPPDSQSQIQATPIVVDD